MSFLNNLTSCLTLLALGTSMAYGADYEVEAGLSRESLSNNRPSWKSENFRLTKLGENHEAFYLGWRETERFHLQDSELQLGTVRAIGSDTHVQLELGTSGTFHILPKQYGDLNVHRNLGNGWGADLGGRVTEYRMGNTTLVRAGVERYLGQERFSYLLFAGGPEGSAISSSHRVQWAHYYGDKDWMGVSAVQGRETDNLGEGVFSTTRVNGVSLSGRHDLSSDWGLIWEMGSLRQGDIYTRNGAYAGLRHSF